MTSSNSYRIAAVNHLIDGAGSVSGAVKIVGAVAWMIPYMDVFATAVNGGPYSPISLSASFGLTAGLVIGGATLVCKDSSDERKAREKKHPDEKRTLPPVAAQCAELTGKFMGVAVPLVVSAGFGLAAYYALTRPEAPKGPQTSEQVTVSGDEANACKLHEVEAFRALSLPAVYTLPKGCVLTVERK